MSRKEPSYWRETPHAFRSTSWWEEFCELCSRPESGDGVEHLDVSTLNFNDPRVFSTEPRRTGVYRETLWHVEGWNSTGGSCSYGAMGSKEQADAFAAELMQGKHDDKMYENYDIVETYHYSMCTRNVHPVLSKDR